MPLFCTSQGLVPLLRGITECLQKPVNISISLAIYLHNRSGPEFTTSSSTPHNPVSLSCTRTTPGTFSSVTLLTLSEQTGCACCPHHLKTSSAPTRFPHQHLHVASDTHQFLLHTDLNDINLSSDNQPRVIDLDLVHTHRSTLLLLFI